MIEEDIVHSKSEGKNTMIAKALLSQKKVSVLIQNCLIPKFFSKKKRMTILCKNIIEKDFDIVFLQEALSLSEIQLLKDHYYFHYEK